MSKASSCSFWIDLHDANGISYSSNSHPPSSGSPPWLCEGGLGLGGPKSAFVSDGRTAKAQIGMWDWHRQIPPWTRDSPRCLKANGANWWICLTHLTMEGWYACSNTVGWAIVLSNSDLSCLRELDLPCFFVAITSFLTWLSLLEKYQIASDIIRDQADPIYPQLYPVDILPDHILPSPGSLIPSDPHRSRCLSLEAPLVEPLPPRPSPPGVRSYPYGYPYGSLMIIFIIYKKNKSIYIYIEYYWPITLKNTNILSMKITIHYWYLLIMKNHEIYIYMTTKKPIMCFNL